MDKLLEYVCDELEELEHKADNSGKLSMQEMQYVDMLAHTKKNLMKAEEMMGEDGYSEDGGSYTGGRSYAIGGSYARGRGSSARRDSMGRYSRESGGNNTSGSSYAGGGQNSNRGGSYERGYSRADAREELAMNLKELKMEAGDPETEQMINKWIKQLEQD